MALFYDGVVLWLKIKNPTTTTTVDHRVLRFHFSFIMLFSFFVEKLLKMHQLRSKHDVNHQTPANYKNDVEGLESVQRETAIDLSCSFKTTRF